MYNYKRAIAAGTPIFRSKLYNTADKVYLFNFRVEESARQGSDSVDASAAQWIDGLMLTHFVEIKAVKLLCFVLSCLSCLDSEMQLTCDLNASHYICIS